MQRRTFIAATAGVAASTVMFPAFRSNAAFTPSGGAPFRPLPELDASSSFSLSAEIGSTRFADGASSETLGFNGAYLGPTLRMRRGQVPKATVRNTTDNPISVHWHGLNVPSNVDGGSHRSAVVPGSTRDFELPIDQPAATLWYHTHVHGRTAPDVHAGLAGAIILDDDESDALGLPSTRGVDDLVLVLQDKSFDDNGRATYDPGMMGVMHGVVGDYILANGQLSPVATVPSGLVRLRLINAGTGALMRFELGTSAVLIATDQGLLPAPIALATLALAPGERAEIIVDMAKSSNSITVAADYASGSMGGMMGGGSGMMGGSGGMMGMNREKNSGSTSGNGAPMQHLIAFEIDPTLQAITSLPSVFTDDPNIPPTGNVVRTFQMDVEMGAMNMMRQMFGGQSMTINGQSYDKDRIDFRAVKNAMETWRVSGSAMAHPFHAHGVRFRIVEPQRPEEEGWKDTVLVEGERDLLVQIIAPSVDDVPFMFHCHILEHEDAGMMGQFLVT